MRKHKEVIQAWLDGKDIQFKANTRNEWADFSEELVSNPMTFSFMEWRIKPEIKQVDCQALIDSELLMYFYDTAGKHKSGYVIGKLKSHNETIYKDHRGSYKTYYKDHRGTYWDCIAFKDDLRQVVSASVLNKLILGGFDVQDMWSYSESYKEDTQVVVILKGIQEGYTL